MSKNETKVVRRRLGADNSRLKEVLLDAAPDTDVKEQGVQNEDLKVMPGETNSPEQAVNSSNDKPAENAEKPAKKKPPVNKRSYQLEELISTVKLINEGKGLDELSQITKRPPASLLYKYFSKRGLLDIRTEEGVREWWAERNPGS